MKKHLKALVTGGSGFIGSHLTERLIKEGWSVSVLDQADFPEKKLLSEINHIKQDLKDFDKVKEAIEELRPDYIFHLAAIPAVWRSIKDPLATINNNVLSTLNVLEAVRQVGGVKRVVLVSSAAVYGARGENTNEALAELRQTNILNPYALSKKWLEDLGKLWASKEIWQAVPNVSLRYFNVYGPRQPREAGYATCIERFLYFWRNKQPFTIVPDGNQRRDFISVFDVVEATIRAALSNKVENGDIFNIGSGKNYSVLEVADIIGGKDYPKVFIEKRPGEARSVLADISKARRVLGWQPKIPLEQGLEQLKSKR